MLKNKNINRNPADSNQQNYSIWMSQFNSNLRRVRGSEFFLWKSLVCGRLFRPPFGPPPIQVFKSRAYLKGWYGQIPKIVNGHPCAIEHSTGITSFFPFASQILISAQRLEAVESFMWNVRWNTAKVEPSVYNLKFTKSSRRFARYNKFKRASYYNLPPSASAAPVGKGDQFCIPKKYSSNSFWLKYIFCVISKSVTKN